MARKTVHVRLPVHVYEAVRAAASDAKLSLSEYVRSEVESALPPTRWNVINVPAKRTAITYSADEDMPERVAQAALEEGITQNEYYVRLLCKSVEVTPCHVVVVKR